MSGQHSDWGRVTGLMRNRTDVAMLFVAPRDTWGHTGASFLVTSLHLVKKRPPYFFLQIVSLLNVCLLSFCCFLQTILVILSPLEVIFNFNFDSTWSNVLPWGHQEGVDL